MTDAKAKRVLESQLPNPSSVLEDSLQHALQALADREALVKTFEDYRFGDVPEAITDARRHMRGGE